jgi:predicted Zn-dependent protease
LAHNVLGHRDRLNAIGRTWGNIRATEREADRLSVWLLANAGYDPAAAARFMSRWGPANDHGILSSPDHDRWRTRLQLIEQELAALARARGTDPQAEANWPRDFRAGETSPG